MANISVWSIFGSLWRAVVCHLSAVTIAEIQAGIETTGEQDVEKANEIEAWLNSVAETYNIIPADAHIFRRWAQLLHRRPDHPLDRSA